MDRRERLDAASRLLAEVQGPSEELRQRAREINEQLWELGWRLAEARRQLAEAEERIEEALRVAVGDFPDPSSHERNGRPVR